MPRSSKSKANSTNSDNNHNKSNNKDHQQQYHHHQHGEISRLLADMPLARAVHSQDMVSLTEILQNALPHAQSIDNVTCEKSVGEAFTGGRSTPVFYITAQVVVKVAAVGGNRKSQQQQQQSPKVISKTRQFVCKLVFMPGGEGGKDNNSIQQKRESYAVERRFYDHVAPQLRDVVAIPKLLASDHNATQRDHYPIACWLMTDVRVQFPLHPTVLLLDAVDAAAASSSEKKKKFSRLYLVKGALDWLAQFHAYSWNSNNSNNNNGNEWRRQLWERGGFWNKIEWTSSSSSMSTKQNSSSISAISSQWLKTCQWLSKHHPDRTTTTKTTPFLLAHRFQALSKPLSEFMLRQSKGKLSTMIHGDFKAANLFFAEKNQQQGDGTEATPEVTATAAAVDFQFTGAGVPSEDVAYFLFPDALVDFWDDERELLGYYHDKLMETLILANKGGPSSFPFDVFFKLYQLSRLELMFYLLSSKGWVASTPGDVKLVKALEETMDQIIQYYNYNGEGNISLSSSSGGGGGGGGGGSSSNNDEAAYRQALETFVASC